MSGTDDEEDQDERMLDVARAAVTGYFGNAAGKSKRLRRGYRFCVQAGQRNEQCSVSVVWDSDRVSLLFSPRPAWALSTFEKLTNDRMASDLEEIPKLAYGASQGRLAVHVPVSIPETSLSTAVYSICSIYDASGPAAGQAPVRNQYLECAKHLAEPRSRGCCHGGGCCSSH